MLQGAHLHRLIDPQLGLIFGYGWATEAIEFVRDHPQAYLSRDEGDIQAWRLPGDILFCGIPSTIHFLFSIDILTRIEVHFETETWDAADVERLITEARSWFTEEFESPEEGVLSVEEVTTRMTLDLLERHLYFEDIEL